MPDLTDTRIKGSGIITIAAGRVYSVVPKDQGGEQSQFVVTNHGKTDATTDGILYVCDNDRNEAIPVYHHESKTIETSAQFEILNSGSVSIYCVVCQMILRDVQPVRQPPVNTPAGNSGNNSGGNNSGGNNSGGASSSGASGSGTSSSGTSSGGTSSRGAGGGTLRSGRITNAP